MFDLVFSSYLTKLLLLLFLKKKKKSLTPNSWLIV